MGRKNKYESNVKPYLSEIAKWYDDLTEGQIAKKLGVSVASFENYKKDYPELVEALQTGKDILVDELKDSLRRKAKGFFYTEIKTIKEFNPETKQIEVAQVIEHERYAAPDTGAIHLLLKNLDKNWRNDDQATMDMKREKLELDKTKAENEW